jgi:hypothetical protein
MSAFDSLFFFLTLMIEHLVRKKSIDALLIHLLLKPAMFFGIYTRVSSKKKKKKKSSGK